MSGPALVGFVVSEESKDDVKSWCNGYSETAVVCGD